MRRIHNYIANKSRVYARWHEHPKHQHIHWLVVVVSSIIVAGILYVEFSIPFNELSNQVKAQAFNFEQRKQDWLADDGHFTTTTLNPHHGRKYVLAWAEQGTHASCRSSSQLQAAFDEVRAGGCYNTAEGACQGVWIDYQSKVERFEQNIGSGVYSYNDLNCIDGNIPALERWKFQPGTDGPDTLMRLDLQYGVSGIHQHFADDVNRPYMFSRLGNDIQPQLTVARFLYSLENKSAAVKWSECAYYKDSSNPSADADGWVNNSSGNPDNVPADKRMTCANATYGWFYAFSYGGRDYIPGYTYNSFEISRDMLYWILENEYAKKGVYETDSMTYTEVGLYALRLLYDFADRTGDPDGIEMKKRAQMTLDLLMLDEIGDFSANQRGGHMGRNYRRTAQNGRELSCFREYIGAWNKNVSDVCYSAYVSNYRPATAIIDLGDYDAKTSSYWRLVQENNRAAFLPSSQGKWNFVTKEFNLGGSTRSRWQLNINSPENNSVAIGVPFRLWINDDLGDADTGACPPGECYNNMGENGYQYRNAILIEQPNTIIHAVLGNATFDSGQTQLQATGSWKNDYTISSGWNFFREGNVGLAIQRSGSRTGLEVVILDPSCNEDYCYADMSAFQSAVNATARLGNQSFTTSRGNVISFRSITVSGDTFNVPTVNGADVFPNQFPFKRITISASGGTQVSWNNNVMVVTGAQTCSYDFNNWTMNGAGCPTTSSSLPSTTPPSTTPPSTTPPPATTSTCTPITNLCSGSGTCSVPGNANGTTNPAITTTATFDPTHQYEFTASGTYRWGPGSGSINTADAEYAELTLIGSPGWANAPGNGLDVYINNNDVNWGAYNSSHTYTYKTSGLSGTVSLRIEDSDVSDNSGSISVTAADCGVTGGTTAPLPGPSGPCASSGGIQGLGGDHIPDLNADGCVNAGDLSVLLGQWGEITTPNSGTHPPGTLASGGTGGTGGTGGAVCNNGTIESGEACDGTNLNSKTCITEGFSGGTLSCNPTTCQLDTSGCTSGTGTTPPPPPPPPGTAKPAGSYPLSAIWQWGGAVPWYQARFDLIFKRPPSKSEVDTIKAMNPGILIVATEDLNSTCGTASFTCTEDEHLHDINGARLAPGPPAPVYWTADESANLSKYSSLTTTIPSRVGQIYQSTGIDGFGTDGAWDGATYGWYKFPSNTDMNNDGVADGSVTDWTDGIKMILQGMRNSMGSSGIIIYNPANETGLASYVNGYTIEYSGWPETNGWEGYKNDWASISNQVVHPQATISAVSTNLSDPGAPGVKKDWLRLVRTKAAEAALLDQYFEFEDHKPNKSADHFWNHYYDELDVDLGQPLTGSAGAIQQVKSGVWARFFEKGVAIVVFPNSPATYPSKTQVSVSDSDLSSLTGYAGPYYTFLGGQDAALGEGINTGSQFSSMSFGVYQYPGYGGTMYESGNGIILVNGGSKTVVSDIIVDESDAGTSPTNVPAQLSGSFALVGGSDSAQCKLGSNYYTVRCDYRAETNAYAEASPGSNGSAVYTVNIGVPGMYDVYEWHGSVNGATMDSNVSYVVNHANGQNTVSVNQSQNQGQWNQIGTYAFNKGNSQNITIRANGNSGTVMADAIRLRYKGAIVAP